MSAHAELTTLDAMQFPACLDENEQARVLYGHQKQLVTAIRHAYKTGHRCALTVMATGGGKTLTSSYVVAQAVAKGKKVLILVHRARLMTQFSAALTKYGVKHGLIAPGKRLELDKAVQVAKVGTMKNRMRKIMWRPDLIVVDEAHHCVEGTMFGQVLEFYSHAHSLLLSATPWRLNGSGLGKGHGGYATAMVLGPDTSYLIDGGYLSKYRMYGTAKPVDMSGAKMKGGDFSTADIEERIKPQIVGNVVSHYAKYARGKRAIVFTPSIAIAERVAADFKASGHKFEAVHGQLSEEVQDALVDKLDRHEIDGLVSVDLVSEGFDLPAIECAIFLRPTASLSLWIQMVGRVLRTSPGKEHAIILDHVGNAQRHGLPDDHQEWSLEGREKRKGGGKSKDEEEEEKIRQCDQCFSVHRPAPSCPACGHVYEVKDREIEAVEGELEEIETAVKRMQRKRIIAKCRTLEDFQEAADLLGYKPGWARIQWDMRNANKINLVHLYE